MFLLSGEPMKSLDYTENAFSSGGILSSTNKVQINKFLGSLDGIIAFLTSKSV